MPLFERQYFTDSLTFIIVFRLSLPSHSVLRLGGAIYKQISLIGSPYKAVKVWEYYPVLFCKHLIFRYVLPEDII